MPDNPDLGKILQAARHHSGRSVKEISQETHIPEAAIRKIEKGQFSRFPSSDYAEIFLAQYGDYLGLHSISHLESQTQPETNCGILKRGRKEQDGLARLESIGNRPPPVSESSKSGRGLLRSRQLGEDDTTQTDKPARGNRAPLLVFSISSILIACSLVVYMELSGELDREAASATQRPAEALGAIGGLSLQTPISPVFSDVPRALPVSLEPSLLHSNGESTHAAKDQNLNARAASPLVTTLGESSLESPPPRAVIVEE